MMSCYPINHRHEPYVFQFNEDSPDEGIDLSTRYDDTDKYGHFLSTLGGGSYFRTLNVQTASAYCGNFRRISVFGDQIKVYFANQTQEILNGRLGSGEGYFNGFGDNVIEIAKLHVYDSKGNHLGENESGGIDLNIEGGIYSPIFIDQNHSTGGEASVRYGNDDYIFEIEGLDVGLIRFDLQQFGKKTGEIILQYNDVSVINGSIGRIFSYSDYHTDPTLYFDDDNDSVVDREIQPTNITNVNVPDVPIKPDGKINGNVGEDYVYKTMSSDSEDDQLFYMWDWGDGNFSDWLGPFDSGIEIEVFHNWTIKGDYEIKVKAKDVFGYESYWSDSLSVTMPRNKVLVNRPILNFLQCHPNLFPILQKLFLFIK